MGKLFTVPCHRKFLQQHYMKYNNLQPPLKVRKKFTDNPLENLPKIFNRFLQCGHWQGARREWAYVKRQHASRWVVTIMIKRTSASCIDSSLEFTRLISIKAAWESCLHAAQIYCSERYYVKTFDESHIIIIVRQHKATARFSYVKNAYALVHAARFPFIYAIIYFHYKNDCSIK